MTRFQTRVVVDFGGLRRAGIDNNVCLEGERADVALTLLEHSGGIVVGTGG